tara:strand:- start:381 stop:1319 length:939 start_codon:yes stop_codon:yes gene_type:complete
MESDKTNINYLIEDDTISFTKLFSLIWDARKLIVLITSVFALCSIFYSLSLTNYYKSEAVLNLADGPTDMASLSRYSGLASMAGISMPGAGEDKGALIVNTIRSRAFLKHLLSFEDILPSIMAAESYDSETKKIVFDSGIYDASDKSWTRKSSNGQQAKPSYIEAFDVYITQMEINYNFTQRLVFVSVEHVSPIFAKEFLDLIIHEADTLIRNKDLQESSGALEYLVSEISKTSLIEMKSSINQLIQSQLETQMMAKVSTDYALKVIEPAFIPEKKSKPSRSLIVVLGTTLGFVFGIIWILARYYFTLNATK